MPYKVTAVKYAVHPEGESPVFGEHTTWIEMKDEGAGPFVSIEAGATVCLDPGEVDLVFECCQKILAEGIK